MRKKPKPPYGNLTDKVLYHLYQPRTRNLSAPERTILQVALPKQLRQNIQRSYHDSIAGGGHLGIQKTFEAIRQKFYWPKMCMIMCCHVTLARR